MTEENLTPEGVHWIRMNTSWLTDPRVRELSPTLRSVIIDLRLLYASHRHLPVNLGPLVTRLGGRLNLLPSIEAYFPVDEAGTGRFSQEVIKDLTRVESIKARQSEGGKLGAQRRKENEARAPEPRSDDADRSDDSRPDADGRLGSVSREENVAQPSNSPPPGVAMGPGPRPDGLTTTYLTGEAENTELPCSRTDERTEGRKDGRTEGRTKKTSGTALEIGPTAEPLKPTLPGKPVGHGEDPTAAPGEVESRFDWRSVLGELGIRPPGDRSSPAITPESRAGNELERRDTEAPCSKSAP